MNKAFHLCGHNADEGIENRKFQFSLHGWAYSQKKQQLVVLRFLRRLLNVIRKSNAMLSCEAAHRSAMDDFCFVSFIITPLVNTPEEIFSPKMYNNETCFIFCFLFRLSFVHRLSLVRVKRF